MRFTLSIALLLSALSSFVASQFSDKPNAFDIPGGGFLLHAGQPQTFSWHNKAGSTVTLTLRNGASGNLNIGTVIKANIPNSGSFTWNVPSTIVEDNSYTVEIKNDQAPSEVNYTGPLNILSPVKAVPTTTAASSSATISSSASVMSSMASISSAMSMSSMASMMSTMSAGSVASSMPTMMSSASASASASASMSTESAASVSDSASASGGAASATASIPSSNNAGRMGVGAGLMVAVVGMLAIAA